MSELKCELKRELKHETKYKIHFFTQKEVAKQMKKIYFTKHKRQSSFDTTQERKRNFVRKKAQSDLIGGKFFIGDCVKQARMSDEYHLKQVCINRGYIFPEYYEKVDISCAAFGLGINKHFDLIPQSHQQLFKRFFYSSGMVTLSSDPLLSLVLSRLLRLERGFLMSYFLIIDRQDFRNLTTICNAFDEIKPVKLRLYTDRNYFKIFSTSNNDPIEGLTKYDLIYVLLRLLEKQQLVTEPLPVSSEYPCIIEYFSLYQTCATNTTE